VTFVSELEKPGFLTCFLSLGFFCTETEHESTSQKHMKNIPYTVHRILLKTNLQWAKEKNTMWKNEDEINESHKSELTF